MPPSAYHKKNSRQVWASNEQFNVMPILKHKTNYPKGGPIKKTIISSGVVREAYL